MVTRWQRHHDWRPDDAGHELSPLVSVVRRGLYDPHLQPRAVGGGDCIQPRHRHGAVCAGLYEWQLRSGRPCHAVGRHRQRRHGDARLQRDDVEGSRREHRLDACRRKRRLDGRQRPQPRRIRRPCLQRQRQPHAGVQDDRGRLQAGGQYRALFVPQRLQQPYCRLRQLYADLGLFRRQHLYENH